MDRVSAATAGERNSALELGRGRGPAGEAVGAAGLEVGSHGQRCDRPRIAVKRICRNVSKFLDQRVFFLIQSFIEFHVEFAEIVVQHLNAQISVDINICYYFCNLHDEFLPVDLSA
ncbi:hypothetical protein NDU88_006491 [Pleurodeles waltl]|uniref:Uncharacterized protein n=1 Tax=Pleurodeles waltl TaxID=8319 RepID=A0AAV7MZD7_PLEWA|nr:hypothetical protein NDU88_006491 [Pleurodeles waltl]